jgi:protein-S-isoprenylcysteine O-methyltransferase Ste14
MSGNLSSGMTRVVANVVGYVALFGAFLLVPAPRPIPRRAWVLLLALTIARLSAGMFIHRMNPAILKARDKPPIQAGQSLLDRVLLLGFMLTFALLVSVASIDGLRMHLLGSVPTPLPVIGLGLFVAGWWLSGYALLSNPFALMVVRPQDEQTVVSKGPYRVIRHPLYLGAVLVMLGESLWLQSVLALFALLIPTVLLGFRIVFEERFLVHHVSGYREYAERVRYRLLPPLW